MSVKRQMAEHVREMTGRGLGSDNAAQPKGATQPAVAAHVQEMVRRVEMPSGPGQRRADGQRRQAPHLQAVLERASSGPRGSTTGVMQRMKTRETTQRESKQSRERSFGLPSRRKRTPRAVHNPYERPKGSGVKHTIHQAIKDKVVWDGHRGKLHWRAGFAERFWRDWRTAGGWRCERRTGSKTGLPCRQPNYQQGKNFLTIGHKSSVYDHVQPDPVTVCDGEHHYEVMLFKDAMDLYHDPANLQPECTACNQGQQNTWRPQGNAWQRREKCPGPDCQNESLFDQDPEPRGSATDYGSDLEDSE